MAPLWTLFRRTARRGSEERDLLSVYRDHGVVPRGFTDDNWNRIPEDLTSYLVVEPGDLVLNKMKAWQGSLGVSTLSGIVSPAYFVYRPIRANFEQRYLHHLLRSRPFVESYGRMSTGVRVAQWDLDPWAFSRLQIPLPPLPEQVRIADFLDRETAKIDTLIEKQNALVDRLRERREAVVESAVNVDAPRASLGFFVRTLPGYAFPSNGFLSDEDQIRLLRGVNVKTHGIAWEDTVYWPTDQIAPVQRYLLDPGDVVLGLDRPFVAGGTRAVRVQAKDTPSLLLQRVLKLTPAGLDPDFLVLILQSRAFREYAEPEFTGVSVPHLSDKQVRDFRAPVPSLDVQRNIASHVLSETAKIDSLIEKAERFVELVRERRAALIASAVTGQLEMEGAA